MTETIQSKEGTEQNGQPKLEYHNEFNVGIMTRDSVRLATIISRPTDNLRRETLVIRTPYNATGFYGLVKMMSTNLPLHFNYVIQDCRGRYNSDGEFSDVVFREHNDTVDTLDWIADQSWSNGDVHMFGPSYMGWVALQALQVRDKTRAHIKSTFSPMTFNSMVDNAIYNSGVLNLHHAYPWCIMMSGRIQGPLNYLNVSFPEAYDIALEKGVAYQGYPSTMWDLFLDYDTLDKLTITYDRDEGFDTKATFIASYMDNVVRAGINAFEEVLKIGGTPPNLIIGPWGHNGYVNSLDSVGKFKITQAQGNVGKDLMEHFTLTNDAAKKDQSLIRVYVLRRDEWITFNSWPLPTTEYLIHFELGEDQQSIKAIYDQPVRTLGGPVWDNHLVKGLNPGVFDQIDINRRPDVIRLYSSEFTDKLTIMGEVRVRVRAKASVAGSHITAKLNLVGESDVVDEKQTETKMGEYIINNGIKIIDDANIMQEHEIRLDFTAFEVKQGEKLMIELSWSNYPRSEKPRHGQDYVIELDRMVPIVLSLQQFQD